MPTVAEMDRYLPASKTLIRRVRRALKYHGVTPIAKHWRMTWDWAKEVAFSYSTFLDGAKLRWPQSNEIAAQYMVLLLNAMKEDRLLKLPFRAGKRMTPAVAAVLPAKTPELMELIDDREIARIDAMIEAEDKTIEVTPLEKALT
jgi:hypothetical protein